MDSCVVRTRLRVLCAHVALAWLAAGTNPVTHVNEVQFSRRCQEKLGSQRRHVEDAEDNLKRLEAGIKNRLMDISQLQKVVTGLDKVQANGVADIKAASTIRGMEVARYEVQQATSVLELARVFKSFGIDSNYNETASNNAYIKLLRNITESSTRAGQTRDDNLAKIGMLRQGMNDSRAVLQDGPERLLNVSELRESNTELDKLVADNIADVRAASIVRGMEMIAYKSQQKGYSKNLADNLKVEGNISDHEVASRQEYEGLLNKIYMELDQVALEREHALETIGGMLQTFRQLDFDLGRATASLAKDKQAYVEMQVSCAKQHRAEGQQEGSSIQKMYTNAKAGYQVISTLAPTQQPLSASGDVFV